MHADWGGGRAVGRGRGQLLSWIFWAAALVAGVVSWLQFLWPPIGAYRAATNARVRDVLLELLKPTNNIYDKIPFLGWAFIVVTVLLVLLILATVRAILDYVENSLIGISILESDIDYVMQTADRTRAIARRSQSFHANRKGISAYHLTYKADAHDGAIDLPTLRLDSMVGGVSITKELLRRGNERSLDVIEMYSKELPTSLTATFLPNWLVAMLSKHGLFEKIVIKRNGECCYINEFSTKQSIVSISAAPYPVTNTRVSVWFITGHEPEKDNIRALFIRENAAKETGVSIHTDGMHTIFSVQARNLYKETLRIQWTNR
jgi:hypothetical protein